MHLPVERRFKEGFERRGALRTLFCVKARKDRALEIGAVLVRLHGRYPRMRGKKEKRNVL